MSQVHNSETPPLRQALPAVLGLTGIFLLSFMSRIILGPLMPAMEADLGLGHALAGRLFMWLAVGVSLGLLASSLLAARFTHRRLIAGAILLVGSGLLLAARSTDMAVFQLALVLTGLGSGVYFPSGIATLTTVTRPGQWGRALAIHELAPNLGLILAPLLAEAALRQAHWRTALTFLGLLGLGGAALFLRGFHHGAFRGHAPRLALLGHVLGQRAFPALAIWFCLGVGLTFGPYSMLPLYLMEHGYARPEANGLMVLARASGLAMALAAGWLTDRMGVRPMIALSLAGGGLVTAAMGPAQHLGPWPLAVLVVLQPALGVCYFPAGFTALSQRFDPQARGVAVSLVTPASALVGGGAVPLLLGWLGEAGRFDLGFLLLGLAAALGLLLLPRLDSPGPNT